MRITEIFILTAVSFSIGFAAGWFFSSKSFQQKWERLLNSRSIFGRPRIVIFKNHKRWLVEFDPWNFWQLLDDSFVETSTSLMIEKVKSHAIELAERDLINDESNRPA